LEFSFASSAGSYFPRSNFGVFLRSDGSAARTGAELDSEAASVDPKVPLIGALTADDAETAVTGLGRAATCIEDTHPSDCTPLANGRGMEEKPLRDALSASYARNEVGVRGKIVSVEAGVRQQLPR
jgi:hypothetical protein